MGYTNQGFWTREQVNIVRIRTLKSRFESLEFGTQSMGCAKWLFDDHYRTTKHVSQFWSGQRMNVYLAIEHLMTKSKMNDVMMSAFDDNCKMGSYQMWFNVWIWNAVARTSDEQIKMIRPCQTSWNTYIFVRCWYFITGKQLFSSNSWPTELLQHSSLPLDGYSRTYTNITNISLYKYMLGPISLTQLSLDGYIRTYTNITDHCLSLSLTYPSVAWWVQ